MKPSILISLLLIFFMGCSSFRTAYKNADDYTTANKVTLTMMGVAQVLDGITTNRAMQAGAVEMNPILGRHPSVESIAIFTVVSIGAKWLAVHFLPAKWRNWFWGGFAVINTGAAIHNNNVYQEIK